MTDSLRALLPLASTAALCLVSVGVVLAPQAGCSTAATGQDDPLVGGEAEWPAPPVDPPGGDGEPGGGGGDGGLTGGGAGTSGGGSGGFGGSFDVGNGSVGTTGGGYMCEEPPPPPATSGGSGGASSSGGGSGSSGTGGGGLTCDNVPGVCEPSANGAFSPCCLDADCGCDTGTCDQQPCRADGYCDCQCTADPDCMPDSCQMPASPPADTGGGQCPTSSDPVVLYMSNDDSNSMASPVYTRSLIQAGVIPPPNRVRIYEFLNYYDLSYDAPTDQPARVGLEMRRRGPESPDFALLLHAQGRKVDPAERRPINLVFSLDTSGSMGGQPIALLRESMRAVAASLRAGDVVSVVTWSDTQEVLLEGYGVAGPNDPNLGALIDGITAGGSTDLESGLATAYDLAKQNFSPERINRVVLISDGGANVGVTSADLIAAEAEDAMGEGIYMVGVGVGEPGGYSDALMDEVTDLGKGAYVFVDSEAEARRLFEAHFLEVVEVAARDVQMELTMPWYFGIKEFYGEEYSADPKEVEPQHLAPNDAMSFHQLVTTCDVSALRSGDIIRAKVTFEDPITRVPMEDAMELSLGELVKKKDASHLYKADAIVAYAQALIRIGDYIYTKNDIPAAQAQAQQMVQWLTQAADTLQDADVAALRDQMEMVFAALQP